MSMNDEAIQMAAHRWAEAAAEIAFNAHDVAQQQMRPSVIFRPTLSLDGNYYCFLYGTNLMDGVAGFGKTAEEAAADFDRNWREQKAPTPARR